MNCNCRPTSSGWGLILLTAAVLALGGCGRKGPLDLPPGASPAAKAAAAAEPDAQATPKPFDRTPGSASGPRAARGVKKPFILDPLLDD